MTTFRDGTAPVVISQVASRPSMPGMRMFHQDDIGLISSPRRRCSPHDSQPPRPP